MGYRIRVLHPRVRPCFWFRLNTRCDREKQDTPVKWVATMGPTQTRVCDWESSAGVGRNTTGNPRFGNLRFPCPTSSVRSPPSLPPVRGAAPQCHRRHRLPPPALALSGLAAASPDVDLLPTGRTLPDRASCRWPPPLQAPEAPDLHLELLSPASRAPPTGRAELLLTWSTDGFLSSCVHLEEGLTRK